MLYSWYSSQICFNGPLFYNISVTGPLIISSPPNQKRLFTIYEETAPLNFPSVPTNSSYLHFHCWSNLQCFFTAQTPPLFNLLSFTFYLLSTSCFFSLLSFLTSTLTIRKDEHCSYKSSQYTKSLNPIHFIPLSFSLTSQQKTTSV